MSVATPVNGDLKPEQGKSVEIGAKYENAGFNATVSLFNINKRNVAEAVTAKIGRASCRERV